MTWIDDIRDWTDGVGGEWVTDARSLLKGSSRIGIENYLSPVVFRRLENECVRSDFVDTSGVLVDQRMIKSPEEIALMHEAGEVVVAMADAAVDTIAEGVPEFEVAISASIGGNSKGCKVADEQCPSNDTLAHDI
jgi:Xaa-Pro aminopeptidase